MTNPIYCALDTTDPDIAAQLAQELHGSVGGLKIGMEYFYATGHAGYQRIVETSVPVFLDLKLHDIPHTVAAAVRAVCPLKPAILNVHAGGGTAMMQAAAHAAMEFEMPPLMIGVTILTSLEQKNLAQMGIVGTPQDQVLRLANLAQESGMGGIVCSAHEIEAIRRECGADFKLIVPGIRPKGSDTHDQKRVMTPSDAQKAGADILVIGRAITKAENPAKAARAISDSLSKSLT